MSWTSPLTVPMRKVPDPVGVGVGQQRAQDVQRALHRAGGDEHLGHEVVAALEARAHLLERRDERVEEHALGLHALLEPRLDVGLHLGRLADERVVVERLQDLLVRHAALSPGSVLCRGARSSAVRLLDEDGGRAPPRARAVRRSVGPEIAERGDDVAGRPADGRGEGAQAGLELVDGGRVAVAAHALELVLERGAVDDRVRRQPRQPPGGELGRAEGEEDLAVGGAVVVDAAPDPLAGAEEVARRRPGRGGRRRRGWGPRG